MSRFVVRTVTGTREAQYMGDGRPYPLSAHVCDTTYLYAVCATYRSDDRGPGPGGYVGIRATLAAAEAHAARLNRDTA